jgi:hypothetical protein
VVEVGITEGDKESLMAGLFGTSCILAAFFVPFAVGSGWVDVATVLAIGCCIVALSLLLIAVGTCLISRSSPERNLLRLLRFGLVVCCVLPCALLALLLLSVFAEAVAGSGST